METRGIERDGTHLHALWRDGIGAPLVVVPGVMTDARGWRHVAAAIDRPEPVLVLNRRGRAPSGDLGPGYGVETEVLDLLAWLDHLGGPVRLFGWSYGGLITIEAATRTDAVRQVIAYEPVVAPFGAGAVETLRAAAAAGDLDRAVEVINLDVSLFPPEHVTQLRKSPAWAPLTVWARPAGEELAAVNAFRPDPAGWAAITVPVDLIVGEHNRGSKPYGTSFDEVARLLPGAAVHVLPAQGHLAHVEAPGALGALVSQLVVR